MVPYTPLLDVLLTTSVDQIRELVNFPLRVRRFTGVRYRVAASRRRLSGPASRSHQLVLSLLKTCPLVQLRAMLG